MLIIILCTAVTATWKGDEITDLLLIYHDEVLVDSVPSYSIGDVGCSSLQMRDSSESSKCLSRNKSGPTTVPVTCQLRHRPISCQSEWFVGMSSKHWWFPGSPLNNFIFVGLYRRGYGSSAENIIHQLTTFSLSRPSDTSYSYPREMHKRNHPPFNYFLFEPSSYSSQV